jgi:hypothetical protein
MYVFNFSVIKGDTFPGQYVFQIMVDGSPLDLTDCHIKADFRAGINIKPAITMESHPADVEGEPQPALIEISDPLQGKFKFAKQIIDIKAGAYIYDVQLTLANGDIFTWLKGTMTVEQDVTQ